MIYTIRGAVVTIGCAIILWGCATSPSELTVAEVRAMKDVELCRINVSSPVGFIPLEIQRRRINCSDLDLEILATLVGPSGFASVSMGNIPSGALNERDCRQIALGQVVNPKVTTTEGAFGRLTTYDNRHHQYVSSTAGTATYVLFDVYFDSGYQDTKLLRVTPNSKQLVLFGGILTTGSRAKVSILGCRAL